MNSTKPNYDPMVDERAAAARLGVSYRTLQGWRWRGGGPAYVKVGWAVRYRLSDIEAFIEERRRRSTSDSGTVAA
ncbi:MAG: hypothetical protein Kow00122_11030 [Thermoleophilia bacterium]